LIWAKTGGFKAGPGREGIEEDKIDSILKGVNEPYELIRKVKAYKMKNG